jgi:hypothetical protein
LLGLDIHQCDGDVRYWELKCYCTLTELSVCYVIDNEGLIISGTCDLQGARLEIILKFDRPLNFCYFNKFPEVFS